MTRHAYIFLSTSIVSQLAAGVLTVLLIQEAARSSEYSQQSYKNGLIDGEIATRNNILRAEIEQEIIKEAEAHMAEERL